MSKEELISCIIERDEFNEDFIKNRLPNMSKVEILEYLKEWS